MEEITFLKILNNILLVCFAILLAYAYGWYDWQFYAFIVVVGLMTCFNRIQAQVETKLDADRDDGE